MYIIVTSLYPNDKAKEVADIFVKAMTKYPPDANLGTPIVPVAVLTTLEGIKTINISEVNKGKLEDALAFAANRLAMFSEIQGYRYKVETYMNLEEAMKTIGM
jgi:hypothetical protein